VISLGAQIVLPFRGKSIVLMELSCMGELVEASLMFFFYPETMLLAAEQLYTISSVLSQTSS
jgi:hypothetical protein